jgi:hypothetical protein
MLKLIGQILPIVGMEWVLVESKHKTTFPDKLHNKETSKKKFNQLKDKKHGTSKAIVPDEVAIAEEVWHQFH